jgi:hypothetical protein
VADNGMDALLVALKRKEAGGPQDDSDVDDPLAPDENDSDDNDQICSLLQEQYPDIYARLSRQVQATGDKDSDGNLSDTTDRDLSDVM